MNAPTAAAVLAKPALQLVSLELLLPSKSHVQELRRARFTKEEIKGLAEDFKVNGMMQQPLVRPLAGGKFEIVAGERRWLAAKVAGMTEIYVSVRELTDAQALVAQLSENLKRKGLHHLEEAEGYEEWMKTAGIKPEEIAESIGQSRSYVYGRLKLLALCPEARKAFYAGEIDSSKALLIARIGHHDHQRQALQVLTKGTQHEQPPATYREAHRYVVENFMLKLKSAPFDTKDANLVAKAGNCDKCPKRTGNHPDLFGDIKDGDVCTDPKCFDDKRQAHYATERKALEAKGKKVVYGDDAKKAFVNWSHPSPHARDHIQGGPYCPLEETIYDVSPYRTAAKLLGDDYEPVLIQHPGTGTIHKVASRSAIAEALQKARSEKDKRSRAAASQKPSTKPAATGNANADQKAELEERILDLVEDRILLRIREKTNGKVDNALLRLIAADAWKTIVVAARQRTQIAIGRAFGWKLKPTYQNKGLPKEAAKLAPPELVKFILVCFGGMELEDGAGALFKAFKVDEKAIQKEVRAEVQLQAVTTAKKPTWSGKVLPATGSKNFLVQMLPSDQLALVIGDKPLQRTEITKKIWGYIKKHGLQDKKNRRLLNADNKLLRIFGGKKQVSMFEMTKLVSKHLRATSAPAKKAKVVKKAKPAKAKAKPKKKPAPVAAKKSAKPGAAAAWPFPTGSKT